MDEDDLKWVKNEKKILLSIKQFHKNVRYKLSRRRKLGNSSDMQNDTLMHRERVNPFSAPFSAGIDFSRQNLTSKFGPHTVRVEIFLMAVDP